MARKDAVSDWSVTPNDNDNVGGVNIAEGCAAANINNGMRTIMSQVKAYTLIAEPGLTYSTKNSDYTALAADDNAFLRFTVAATLSLTAAATLTSGWHCLVKADGGPVTIDPDGAETIDGAASIVVGGGYSALVVCTGTSFFSIPITPQLHPYVTVASAATTDIGAASSQNVVVSGSVTITSFGTVAAGTVRDVVFSGSLTLTHNATSLILPYGANITTTANESLRAVSLGGGNWRVTEYQKAVLPALTTGVGLTSSGSIVAGNMTVALDVYAGSDPNLVDYPVGEQLVVGGLAPLDRNASASVFTSLTGDRWVGAGGVAQLSGTWRNKGFISTGTYLMRKTAS